jgi:uncharacterized protein (DUF1697 family)
MTTYIALLRGVNVGGHKKVAMADIRALLSRMGFEDPQSLLQSGNLAFRGKQQSIAKLEQSLESEIRKRLSVETMVFVRTVKELETVVSGNPFPGEGKSDPGHLVVIFFKGAPAPEDVKSLQKSHKGPEVIRAEGREAYIKYPDGQGTSRLTLPVIERALKTKGTGRNWNTVLKLADVNAA